MSLFESPVEPSASLGPVIDRVQSFTREDVWYEVDRDARTCTCPAFRWSRKGDCKHLASLGVGKEGGVGATVIRPRDRRRKTPFVPSTRPTFSQALSALVKTIRLRRVEEAIYWLVYVDSFPEEKVRNGRFRLGRRIFVSCCEDGMSVAVMEAVTKMLWPMTKPATPLEQPATEVVRICKVPKWWDPSTGGPDYMRHGYLGHLRYVVRSAERDREVLKQAIVDGIAEGDKAKAMGAIDAIAGAWDQTDPDFNLRGHPHTPMSCGLTADFLVAIAREGSASWRSAWPGFNRGTSRRFPTTQISCITRLGSWRAASVRWRKRSIPLARRRSSS
jgi:hypothetical protein